MPTKPESRLAQRIKDGLTGCYVTRIESRVNLGIPDCLIAFPSRFVMVELKVVDKGLKVNLSPHQISFLMAHAFHKCPVFVVVHYKAPRERHGELLVYAGADADKLADVGVRHEPLARWPINGVVWADFKKVLTSGTSLA